MILDHVDGLKLHDKEVERYFNELRSLRYLSTGLNFLNNQIQELEADIIARIPEGQNAFGNAPELEGIPQDIAACAFHWYSVTACNFVKLVGWLSHEGDSDNARRYLQRVIPKVYVWRNKVGAHFARIDPRKEDSPADLAASVTFPVGFENGALHTSPFRLMIASGKPKPTPHGVPEWRWRHLAMSGRQITSSRGDMKWSLTDTHRQLALRYWPNQAS